MSYRSKKQARWAHATNQSFARRWDKEANFAALKDGTTMAHGPGGLLATPALGARRKWGKRLKSKQIVGNLYRGNDGKFQAGGTASTPADRATRTEQRRASRQARGDARAAKRDEAAGTETSKRTEEDAYIDAGATGAERQKRRQQVAADRRQRSADRQAANRAASAEERMARQQEDAAERTAQAADVAAKKPKGSGGGGGKAKPTNEQKRQETEVKRQQNAIATGARAGLDQDMVKVLGMQAEGSKLDTPRLDALGLTKNGEATDQGRRTLAALQRGDLVGVQAALQDAKASMIREARAAARQQATATVRQERNASRAARETERNAKQQQRLHLLTQRAAAGAKLTQTQRDQLTTAGLAEDNGSTWRLKVYKDRAGAHRWIARTTTAYRDRDDEIIAEAALDADSQRMTADQRFGPLRWWHVGEPEPLNNDAPWGPGLDLGDCDFSMLIGRTRVESGTFKSAEVAEQVARIAEHLEMSPGFFHPLDQPTTDGVFTDIRTFERSLVPIRHGRASNLFTGFTVKEHRMDIAEMERRFEAAIRELHLSPEQATALSAQLVATEKTAQAQGVAFKSAEHPVYTAFDGTHGIILNGMFAALKAAPPAPVAEEAVAAEDVQADDLLTLGDSGDNFDVTDDDALEPDDVIGNLTWDEFAAKLTDILAPVLKMQDMVKSITEMGGELKSMYGGASTKDDARAHELATLKDRQQILAAKIAQIEGSQPAVVLSADVEAALKSTGPAAPQEADPTQPVIPNDPNRPFAALAAQTAPYLYTDRGWQQPH